MWEYYNPNPCGKNVGDCTVRAMTMALGEPWDTAYARLVVQGYLLGDMPSSDAVWGAVLRAKGFKRNIIPNSCPDCYTVADFAAEHPTGTFVLALGGHVLTLKDGIAFDSWDSTGETPIFYYEEDGNGI